MKRYLQLALCVLVACQSFLMTVYAKPEWPADIGIQAEGGIVIDADTGAVLFGQNIHKTYPPASITKLLTALVVLENCQLDETVTFSHDAVYNLEVGSGNPLRNEEGDTLSVEDCLYGMLLRSSNQMANALAEHVAGSREAFVQMMNARAVAAGCKESNFANPSGLNDPNQFTSPYDMSRIARAAFANPKLLEIDSTLSRPLPATQLNPEGITARMEHKMLLTSDSNYYEAAVAGKTGFTSLAGNTLVTYASKDGRNLIAVVLKSNQTHYSDTKTMLDLGFSRFQNVNVADYETDYITGDEPVVIGDATYQPSGLSISTDLKVSLPKDASFTDLDKSLKLELTDSDPEGAVAWIQYTYNDRYVGFTYLFAEEKEPVAMEPPEDEAGAAGAGDAEAGAAAGDGKKSGGFKKLPIGKIAAWAAGIAVLAAGVAGVLYFLHLKKEEERQLAFRRERRRRRLMEEGCTEEEFNRLVEERMRRSEERYQRR